MAQPFTTQDYLRNTDPKVSDLDYDKWNQVGGTEEQVERAVRGLQEVGHQVTLVDTPEEALSVIKSLIPKGAKVNNAGSMTLHEIGMIEHLKRQTDWINLHAQVLAEPDPVKQAELRRQFMVCDYFLTSVNAITEQGTLVVVDYGGTRTGAFPCAAAHVVVVAGVNKIVTDEHTAVKRCEEFSLQLESARVRIAYKLPTSNIANLLCVRRAAPFGPSRYHIVLVKERLGY